MTRLRYAKGARKPPVSGGPPPLLRLRLRRAFIGERRDSAPPDWSGSSCPQVRPLWAASSRPAGWSAPRPLGSRSASQCAGSGSISAFQPPRARSCLTPAPDRATTRCVGCCQLQACFRQGAVRIGVAVRGGLLHALKKLRQGSGRAQEPLRIAGKEAGPPRVCTIETAPTHRPAWIQALKNSLAGACFVQVLQMNRAQLGQKPAWRAGLGS